MYDVQIRILPALSDNYIFLFEHEHEAAVVDPAESRPVHAALRELDAELKTILITHHHADHVGGCRDLKTKTQCLVVGPDDARIPGLDQVVREHDRVSVFGHSFQVFFLPGHTRTHIGYYAEADGVIFAGDTLFAGGCGRLFEGTASDMWSSLQKLRSLPDETRVYCGHEYTLQNLDFAAHIEPTNTDILRRRESIQRTLADGRPSIPTSIGEEKRTNPFFRVDVEAFQKAVNLVGTPPEKIFAEVRNQKDRW